jgi:hypothetical protein
MSQVVVNGVDQVGRALAALPYIIARKYLRRATFNAIEVIRVDAEARAPVRTGDLKANIAVFRRADVETTAHYALSVRGFRLSRKIKRVLRILRKANGGQRQPITGDTYYWRLQELGWHDKKGVFHRNSFLRPAFEAQKDAALERFRLDLGESLPAAAAEARTS